MAKTKNDKKKELKPAEELFCQFFAGDSEYFNNGTWSYIQAYGIKVPARPHSTDLHYTQKKRAYDKVINTAAVGAHDLLRKPKIKKRCGQVLDDHFKDEVVDRQHAKVLLQNKDLNAKMRAVTEYNKLKKRVSDEISGTLVVKWG